MINIRVWITFVFALCVLSQPVHIWAAGDQNSIEECMRAGKEAYIKGEYIKSLVYYTQAVALGPYNDKAIKRLQFVADEVNFLDEKYKEWLFHLNISESDRSEKFKQSVEEALDQLNAHSNLRNWMLRKETEQTIAVAIAGQNSIILDLKREIMVLRVITFSCFAVLLALFAYYFKRGRKKRAG